jgi:hypothetical protein
VALNAPTAPVDGSTSLTPAYPGSVRKIVREAVIRKAGAVPRPERIIDDHL